MKIFNEEKGGVAVILGTLLVILASVFILVFYVFGQVVYPNQVGIRQNYFGFPGLFEQGFEAEGLAPGLHWKLPLISTVHLIPRDFQFVNFNDRTLSSELDLPQLEIPTIDGSKVKTDLTMVIRFFETPRTEEERVVSASETIIQDRDEDKVPFSARIPRSHGGPGDLVNTYKTSRKEQLGIFAVTAEESIKEALSNLSTSDYYNPVLRERAALIANESINEDVNPDGIELWATLIRRYVYSEKNIDDQIFAKNLQEATEQLNKAERALEQARAETEMTKAAWDAEIKDLKVAGEQDMKVLMSEGERIEIEKKSEGDRLVEEARAEVDRAKNVILTNVSGADIYVAREMTPLLETLQGGIVTDIDPFNIDQWMEKLIAKTGGSATRAKFGGDR
jgi:hypothetical protein